MQHVLDHWDGLLRATGGALEKSKSYWYLLDYAYQQGRWVIKPKTANPGDISLYNDIMTSPIKRTIDHLNPAESRKALGIYTNPQGNMQAEKLYLRQKAETWAASFWSCQLQTGDAWYCFTSTIMKTIEYPLVTTSFSKKDCAYFMAPILRFGLQSVRIQRQLPRALVYAPLKYQAIGLHDP